MNPTKSCVLSCNDAFFDSLIHSRVESSARGAVRNLAQARRRASKQTVVCQLGRKTELYKVHESRELDVRRSDRDMRLGSFVRDVLRGRYSFLQSTMKEAYRNRPSKPEGQGPPS